MAIKNSTVPLFLSFASLMILQTAWTQAQSPADEPLRRIIDWNGERREYFVHLPPDYVATETYWLLITVHGGGGNGRSHFLCNGIRKAASELELEAIVVSPSFSNSDFQASRFPALGEGEFLQAVVQDLRLTYSLKPKIFLSGYSRGGQFSHRFAFDHPELVEAVAPFASGTWTTPDGALLIESFGKVADPASFLTNPENRNKVTERLHDIFSDRVARVAGKRPRPDSQDIPFLVMCGTLDTRYEIAQEFAQSLLEAGYQVQTDWPRTPHGSRDKEEFKNEFEKYSRKAVEFFLQVAKEN